MRLGRLCFLQTFQANDRDTVCHRHRLSPVYVTSEGSTAHGDQDTWVTERLLMLPDGDASDSRNREHLCFHSSPGPLLGPLLEDGAPCVCSLLCDCTSFTAHLNRGHGARRPALPAPHLGGHREAPRGPWAPVGPHARVFSPGFVSPAQALLPRCPQEEAQSPQVHTSPGSQLPSLCPPPALGHVLCLRLACPIPRQREVLGVSRTLGCLPGPQTPQTPTPPNTPPTGHMWPSGSRPRGPFRGRPGRP